VDAGEKPLNPGTAGPIAELDLTDQASGARLYRRQKLPDVVILAAAKVGGSGETI